MTVAILPTPEADLGIRRRHHRGDGDFYGHELRLGQTNLLLATAIVAAVLAMKQRREMLAGGLIAVAVVLKPYAVLLLPWLLSARNEGLYVAATIGMLVVLLLPVARYGFESAVGLHVDWWRTVTLSRGEPAEERRRASPWLAMYTRWFGMGEVAQALTMITIVAALAAAVDVFQRRRTVEFPELLEASLLLTLMPLMSPQGWGVAAC